MNLASAAAAYASHGRPVFPLVPGGKRPMTRHGVKDAMTSAAFVRQWWKNTPRANIGLAILPHEIVVDVDVRNGGDQTLLAWLEEHGALPATPTQQTPTTGSHFLFRRPAGVELVGNPGAGIDVLGAGKYIVAAPSRIDGRNDPYAWTTRLSKSEPADLPPWLAKLVTRRAKRVAAPPPRLGKTSANVLTRATRYLERCDPAIQGSNGSATCFRVAVKLARGFALDEETATDLLERVYNPRCDPPWSRRELQHKVKQAIAKGDYEWGALRDRPHRGAA